MFLKPSSLAIHRRHGHKNTPPFRELSTSATYSMSYLRKFSNCDDATVDCIAVNSEYKNLTAGIGNSISRNYIDS